ncbi:metallophosphoesterase [Bacteroidales bacterium OttesenSCG-928-M11]|nr:metallophosphoesterase [Bacteroidales bacterium OttesenSCG-928-M11]
MNPFFIVVFLVYILTNSYIFYRGWQALPDICSIKIIYTVVYLFISLSFFVAMGGKSILPLGVQKIFYWIGVVWLGVMLYITLFFVFTDLIHLINHFFRFLPITGSSFHQIQVISGYALVAFILIVGNIKFTHPEVIEEEIVVDKDGGKYSDLRVVAFSDMHIGLYVDKKNTKKYVDFINSLNPDVIIIAGDLIDNNIEPLLRERINEELDQLIAPLGIYFCPGNHEYISGIDASLNFIAKTKIQVLKDSVVRVGDSFWIIGRDDRSVANRVSLKQLIEKTDSNQPLILLDHQPYNLSEAEINGVDLQFSGHTHNGQLWPLNLLVKKIYEVGSGYKKKGNTHYYVSSGLALWGPPFRVGTRSEAVVFNLKFKD